MGTRAAGVAAFFAVYAGCAHALPAAYVAAHVDVLWAAFKADHGRMYETGEDARRRAIFEDNMLRAAAMEARSATGAVFGATKFADLTAAEFAAYHTLRLPGGRAGVAPRRQAASAVPAPAGESKDWREFNAVTAVKDQAICGGCYAFSTTGAIEGHHAVRTGELVSLSEQQIIECSNLTQGCAGGWQELAMQFLVSQRGGRVVTEAAMPWYSGSGEVPPTCGLNATMRVGAIIAGAAFLPADEDQIAAYLVAHGPVAITVDAASWQLYLGGIFDTCTYTALNHAVTAVGVTPEFWVIKNSWGTLWGESGYVRLRRGTNECGMKDHVVVPTF